MILLCVIKSIFSGWKVHSTYLIYMKRFHVFSSEPSNHHLLCFGSCGLDDVPGDDTQSQAAIYLNICQTSSEG